MRAVDLLFSLMRRVGATKAFGVPGTDLIPVLRGFEGEDFSYFRVPNEQEIPAIGAGVYIRERVIPVFLVAPPGLFNLLGSMPHLIELEIPCLCICGMPSSGRRPYLQDVSLFPVDRCSFPLFDGVFWLKLENVHCVVAEAEDILDKGGRVLVFSSFSDLEGEVLDAELPEPYGKGNAGDLSGFFRAFLKERASSSRGAVVVGPLVQRYGIEKRVERVLNLLSLPWVLSTSGPVYLEAPMYAGLLGWAGYRETFEFVRGLDYLLSIGDWFGSISVSSFDFEGRLYSICSNFSVSGAVSVSGDMGSIIDSFVTFLESADRKKFPSFSGELPTIYEGGDYRSKVEKASFPLSFSRFFYRFLKELPEDLTCNIFVGHGQYLLMIINIASSMLKKNVRYHCSIYYGWMGWSPSSAVGYALSGGDGLVVSFLGDGTFYMHSNLLLMVRDFSIPVLFVVMNNGRYSMIHLTYKKLFGNTVPESMITSSEDMVESISKGYGVDCMVVKDENDMNELFSLIKSGDLKLPLVVDLVLDPEEEPHIVR